MPQVRCTQCGAVNDTDAPDYPFCIGCQDSLAKCGYCQHFDEQLVACTHPAVAGVFEVSAEATPPCDYHEFRPSLVVRSRGLWVVVAVGFAAALFTLGYAVLQLRQPLPPPPAPEPRLVLWLEGPREPVPTGRPFVIAGEVSNVSDMVAREVRLLINKDLLRDFEVVSQPGESPQWREEGAAWVLETPAVAPGESKRMALELIPKRAGEFQLDVKVESDQNLYHGSAPVFIRAKSAALSSTSRGRERKVQP